MTATSKKASPLFVHGVYFRLKDQSERAKQKLTAACKKYLCGHPGTVFSAAGVRAEECVRQVNDRDFDVAWTIVFEDAAAHDAYQKSERHLTFVAENQADWEQVRVFDSQAVA
jgi:hypothetical protein